MAQRRIYLDNNATTFLDPRVKAALIEHLDKQHGNPSSTHSFGRASNYALTFSRRTVADFFNVDSQEIIFTSGGTEAINLCIRGVIGLEAKGHIISSDLEHSAVFTTVKTLQRQGCRTTFLHPGAYGAPCLQDVEAAIEKDTRLIVLMAVNNETGVMTDIEAIASLAQARGIPFVVDGVALLGKEPFNRFPRGVSAMCFSGHKFHACQGIGIAYIRQDLELVPYLIGGGHEYGRRSGTENLPGIVSLSKAVALLKEELPQAAEHMRALRDRLENNLKTLPDVTINGTGPRVSNTTNISFHGVDGEALLVNLDRKGIAVSHGSACSAGALQVSRVLLNMGIPREVAGTALRMSLSRMTTQEEVDIASEIISQMVKHLRAMVRTEERQIKG